MDRRFAILGDIHSNLEALTAVVNDARSRGATDFVCVGDVVGYNADPSACIDLIRELNCACVRGNHDHYCSSDEEVLEDFQPLAANVIAWTRRQLSEDERNWLGNLPLSRMIMGFTLVHSTLDMPDHWGYVFDLLDAEAHFNYQTTTLCFHGHTHVPLVFEKRAEVIRAETANLVVSFGVKYFINVGSVGQPRDGDPRSSYVMYIPKIKKIEFHRVTYDFESAAAKVRAAGLPERNAQRLGQGR